MPVQLVKCDTAMCDRESYPNQMRKVDAGGIVFLLCPGCYAALMRSFSDKPLMGAMLRATMTTREIQRMRRERAEAYATRDFDFSGFFAA